MATHHCTNWCRLVLVISVSTAIIAELPIQASAARQLLQTPTSSPTSTPTSSPTSTPTLSPTSIPTSIPTSTPTSTPTSSPTSTPTLFPTAPPTSSPTDTPTSLSPTMSPTSPPTTPPTTSPTMSPSSAPTTSPTSSPTSAPTTLPTVSPTESPTLYHPPPPSPPPDGDDDDEGPDVTVIIVTSLALVVASVAALVINYMFRPREYENAGFASDKQDLGAEEGEKTQITEADKQTAKFVLFHFWTYRKKNRKEKDMFQIDDEENGKVEQDPDSSDSDDERTGSKRNLKEFKPTPEPPCAIKKDRTLDREEEEFEAAQLEGKEITRLSKLKIKMNKFSKMLPSREREASETQDENWDVVDADEEQLRAEFLKREEEERLARIAAEEEAREAAKLAAAEEKARKEEEESQTNLFEAAETGNVEMIRRLLGKKHSSAHINAKNLEGKTALHLAAINNQAVACTVLRKFGASLKKVDTRGWTPLMAACAAEKTDAMKALLAPTFLLKYTVWKHMRRVTKEVVVTQRNMMTEEENKAIDRLDKKNSSVIVDQADINAITGDGKTCVHISAEKGMSINMLCLLKDNGADLEAQDSRGRTAMHYAAYVGSTEIVQLLWEMGVSVVESDFEGMTPFHFAAMKGRHKTLSLIKDIMCGKVQSSGAMLKQLNDSVISDPIQILRAAVNRTYPLGGMTSRESDASEKARRRWKSIADLVHTRSLPYDVDLEFNDVNDMVISVEEFEETCSSELHQMVITGNVKGLKKLLKGGADIMERDSFGRTAMHFAADKGYLHMLEVLCQKGGIVGAEDMCGQTAMHVAAKGGKHGVVRLLGNLGGNVHSQDIVGQTPMHLAASHGCYAVIQELWNLGAPLDIPDKMGQFPLHNAARSGEARVIPLLKSLGAQMEAVDLDGHTAVDLACKKGQVSALIAMRDIGVFLKPGQAEACTELAEMLGSDQIAAISGTALHYAARTGNTPLLKTLYELGIELEDKDADGMSAIHVAASNGHSDAILFLWQVGVFAGSKDRISRAPLHFAALKDQVVIVDLLVALGEDIHTEDSIGRTAMHVAAEHGQLNALESLAAAGADIDRETFEGWAPLHFAAWNGMTKAVQALIDLGAQKLPVTTFGQTPAHVAAMNGKHLVLTYLHSVGISVEEADAEGFTPVQWAAKKGQLKCVEVLIQVAGVDVQAQQLPDINARMCFDPFGNTDAVNRNLRATLRKNMNIQKSVQGAKSDVENLASNIIPGIGVQAGNVASTELVSI